MNIFHPRVFIFGNWFVCWWLLCPVASVGGGEEEFQVRFLLARKSWDWSLDFGPPQRPSSRLLQWHLTLVKNSELIFILLFQKLLVARYLCSQSVSIPRGPTF